MSKNPLPIAFLTTDDLHGHVSDDQLAVAPLQQLGWQVVFVSWRQPTDWRRFAGVVIRTPWDYTDEPDAFVDVLKEIEDAGTALANPLPMVRWNLNKTYLRELASAGLSVVQTQWIDVLEQGAFDRAFEQFACQEMVLKPQLGASAKDTFRLGPSGLSPEILGLYAGRPCMLQPFLAQVVSEGEYSLFYFSGQLSHTINKRPAAGDFRVQEEHGGLPSALEPEPGMCRLAQQVLDFLPQMPLYGRVDMVRSSSGFALMELELVEPSLYLRLADHAPLALARAIDHWLAERN